MSVHFEGIHTFRGRNCSSDNSVSALYLAHRCTHKEFNILFLYHHYLIV